MNDDISPEIAALLQETSVKVPSKDAVFRIPDPLPETQKPQKKNAGDKQEAAGVDLSLTKFAPVEAFFSDEKTSTLRDPAYYKTALSGENENAQKLHSLLSKYLACQDPKDRTVYRQQIINVYWEVLRSLAPKMGAGSVPPAKKLLMRFAIVLPALLTEEQKDLFSSVFMENVSGEPVYYLDEWFRGITLGNISLSATDEARPARKSGDASADTVKIMQLQNKNNGKLQNAFSLLAAKSGERTIAENDLASLVKQLSQHPVVDSIAPHGAPLSEAQKRLFADITEKLKALQKIDKEYAGFIAEYSEAKAVGNSLKQKLENAPETAEVNSADIMTEMNTIRQMAKMTVGRQGNHYPILTREYFHCIPRGMGTRENVVDMLAWVESVDPGAFCRVHRNTQNRIIPYVILVPTYGDSGFCWEPFDRYNRITSRGRIVVPMYPKNLQLAVLTAVADLRWQVAKEKASYYWMEEGLTGQYYQWISSQKLKGDLKDFFISDYILWMTKESEGVQRLDKEVRAIFWRFLPFPQEIKEKLKTRSLVYQELFQRDINRSMSDGY
ncbi:MAG: hypothetical protein NC041_00335 [Bacteroides sp.]|nr:hypothetical protein [Prevotella sp.]MCM1408609.1 hypothetical protein [Treponema brennaborense]MCM1468903.1 hypothetical protein [Bacteroides sp.]